MPRKLPPRPDPAADETIAEHLRIGGRWLRAAQAAYPDLSLIEALVKTQKSAGPLRPRSIVRYRADLRYALTQALRLKGRECEIEDVLVKMEASLQGRRRQKKTSGEHAPERRTSADKVVDADEEDVRALFYELKRHALAHGNPNAIMAALFVLVAGHSGFRPVELRGATLDGNILTLPNAKKRPGQGRTRQQDLSELHEDVRTGLLLLLSMIDHDLTKKEFAKWQKVLAQQMRRACERLEIPVLSLYSFRHVAIACWSASGLPPEEIARLCGHTSIRTAHTHYARAGVGHKRKAVAKAVPTVEPVEAAATGATPVAADHSVAAVLQSRPLIDIDDMPVPAQPKAKGDVMSADEVRHRFEHGLDTRSAEEIGASLRRAGGKRDRKDARRSRPGPSFPEG